MEIKSTSITGFIILFFTLAAFFFQGCHKKSEIEGNEIVKSEIRRVVSFNKIDNQDEFDVYYIYDTIFKVEIEAESNLIAHIRTIINGNILEIDTRENLDNNFPINIFVHAPSIDAVHLSGSGLIAVGDIIENDFEATISGSGIIYGNINCNYFQSYISGSGEIDFAITSQLVKAVINGSGVIKLSGESYDADYKISGSGSILASNMELTECISKVLGSGDIHTSVSDYLQAIISGSGNIYYKGSPNIDANISGSGNIIKE